MPHIIVKMHKGRTEEMKQAMVEKMREAVVETIGCPENVVTFAVEDYEPSDFKELFKKDVAETKGTLYFVNEKN